MKAEGVKDEIDSCCNDLTQGVHRAVDNISYGHSRLHPLKKGKRMIGKLLKRFVWTAEKVLAKTFPEE